jgi:hypothetical protein
MNALMLAIWTVGFCSVAYWLARATKQAAYERLLDDIENDYILAVKHLHAADARILQQDALIKELAHTIDKQEQRT